MGAAGAERFMGAAPLEANPCAALKVVVAPLALPRPELADAWDRLVPYAAEPNAYAERWFVEAGLRHLGGSERARLIEVWSADGGILIGLAPLTIASRYGRMAVGHLENWAHFHSFCAAVLVRRGHEQAFWQVLLDALDDADWAPAFLHLTGIVEDGPIHRGLAAARRCDTVFRTVRALLESDLGADAYYAATVRKKKRKEYKRQAARLAEAGTLTTRRLGGEEPVGPWCDDFLALEAKGWKGAAGSALAAEPATDRFFRAAIDGARTAGRLDFLRMDLDGRPIAMLANFLTPPGAFSFKTAFDEAFARFSPGVLIQLENLHVLERGDVRWMDSCAAQDHSMIDSLWGERRAVVRVTVPLKGARRRALFTLCRGAEQASALVRRLRAKAPAAAAEEG